MTQNNAAFPFVEMKRRHNGSWAVPRGDRKVARHMHSHAQRFATLQQGSTTANKVQVRNDLKRSSRAEYADDLKYDLGANQEQKADSALVKGDRQMGSSIVNIC
jgi:hypothetical protein